MRVNEQVPTIGYELPLWNTAYAYRSTAVAYLQREGVRSVKHFNGSLYTLRQLKDALIMGRKRPTVKTHWLEAVASKWYENQPEVVKQTLKPHVYEKENKI